MADAHLRPVIHEPNLLKPEAGRLLAVAPFHQVRSGRVVRPGSPPGCLELPPVKLQLPCSSPAPNTTGCFTCYLSGLAYSREAGDRKHRFIEPSDDVTVACATGCSFLQPPKSRSFKQLKSVGKGKQVGGDSSIRRRWRLAAPAPANIRDTQSTSLRRHFNQGLT